MSEVKFNTNAEAIKLTRMQRLNGNIIQMRSPNLEGTYIITGFKVATIEGKAFLIICCESNGQEFEFFANHQFLEKNRESFMKNQGLNLVGKTLEVKPIIKEIIRDSVPYIHRSYKLTVL